MSDFEGQQDEAPATRIQPSRAHVIKGGVGLHADTRISENQVLGCYPVETKVHQRSFSAKVHDGPIRREGGKVYDFAIAQGTLAQVGHDRRMGLHLKPFG
jgi:hypothetical protein